MADRAHQEIVLLARIAALTQILAPEPPSLRLGLVKYLAATSHAEATRALARLAVFSEEEEVRSAAVAALKVRRERDYTDVLLASLRYPWPAVAQRGAEAIVKLERTDLMPQLVALLDEPDPRAPVEKVDGGHAVSEVRELVRVNHHRNCMLCHAPGNTAGVSPETLTASVPLPSDPLPDPADGYQTSSPDITVRIDVTYLRPDFSVRQAVADANPWPEMQRFDYLVRSRTLTAEEAAAARTALAAREPGTPSPYQRSALAALRELTGRDAAPTAEAWRRLLNLPAGSALAVPVRD
jgi:mono/diheme cytochrome c family protein